MDRRLFIKLTSLLGVIGLVQSCDKRLLMNDQYQDVIVPDFSNKNLHDLLNKLLSAYERKGMKLSESLLPPISETELIEQCSWFPGVLTPELISLYGWRGGQKEDAWESEYPFWFRDMSFCSLERAKHEYDSMMKSYGSYPEDRELLKYSFPFASFSGGWYVIPTKGQPFSKTLRAPVISVFQDIAIYYFSIELMVKTCIEWVESDKYNEDDIFPEELESSIWQKHNPGIFEN